MGRNFIITLVVIFISQSVLGQDKMTMKKPGIYYGLNFGTWFPDNNNKVLGHPRIIGLTGNFKLSKNAFGLNFELISGKTNETIYIKSGNNVISRNEYNGAQFTLDYYRQFAETKRFVFEVMSSIGYGELSYYNPDKDTNIYKASLVFSPGTSIRYLIHRKFYLQLKTQYSFSNYDLNDNVSTSLRGNYLTTKIIFGGLLN